MIETEQSAIRMLREGNIKGLEMLVRLYQVRALRAAYGITGDPHAAEDVVADAFLAVYDRISTFDPNRPFAPWFYRIVVNGALKSIRTNKRTEPKSENSTEWLNTQHDTAPGPAESAEYNELRLLLLDAIYELPPQQRAALILRYYLNMDEATIAETLGCPQGTVKWRLHAARQKMRESLIPHALADGI
ncbi:MAG: RNA polymerase sigma factor [Chloroflexota bacterium]